MQSTVFSVWCSNLNLEGPIEKYKSSMLCSDHFHPDDLKKTGTHMYIREGAMPFSNSVNNFILYTFMFII